ncbi:Hypp6674 [Branchiostoma lanceolatum]|uniref:Hypp6674 protein n=1 Tax=Branchiostoma lanceolatum TaxID=7740 RepID=A0A8J9YVD5_BRALA|nr:Hypp6674 [Branchiostoma lanceolatum]
MLCTQKGLDREQTICPHSGFARPNERAIMATPTTTLGADATFGGHNIVALIKEVRAATELPPEDQRARFIDSVALHQHHREEPFEHLRRLTGEDPATLLEMAGLDPTDHPSTVRLASKGTSLFDIHGLILRFCVILKNGISKNPK